MQDRLFAAGIGARLVGTAWSWWLQSRRPQTYRGIGAGGELD
ncbi:hypothetical protein [Microbacterium sp. A93]